MIASVTKWQLKTNQVNIGSLDIATYVKDNYHTVGSVDLILENVDTCIIYTLS